MMSMAGTMIGPFSVHGNPLTDRRSGYAGFVNPHALKRLLAGNLDRLLNHDADRRRDVRLSHGALAAKAGIGKGTVGRILRAEDAPAIDTVQAIAEVFSWQAWQMLIPDIDPAAPPELMTPTVRQELIELRAMRAQLEELARGGQGSYLPPGVSGGRSTDRKNLGDKPTDAPAAARPGGRKAGHSDV